MRKVGRREEDVAAKEKGAMKQESRLVPTMILRVLLVEPDDSTRHVITALLRKCGHKVAAVADGLKAWELLKGASSNVDLVLTEVELPSVSGVALITLAMEQEIYKNIPFIMMSSHDSIGTVFNCMLKGAADYLVKPIRRNELHNLWQHVWRRRSVDENSPVDGSNSPQNAESTAGGDALVNRKHIISSIEREEEFHGKENYVQSSPELVVIDLIGPFDDNAQRQRTDYFFHHPAKHLGLSTKLNLSLKRSEPHDLDNSETDEGYHSLKKSNDSAFSRYINDSLQLPKSCSHNNSSSETPTPLSTPKSTLSFPTSWPRQKEHILPHQSNSPSMNLELSSPGLVSHQDTSLQLNSSSDQSVCNGHNSFNESLSRFNKMDLENITGSGARACPNEAKCHNFTILDGLSQRAHKREAALMKFRVKKKVLCFEKKVRYESRKKLAEKRPRVKGQFVRRETFDV